MKSNTEKLNKDFRAINLQFIIITVWLYFFCVLSFLVLFSVVFVRYLYYDYEQAEDIKKKLIFDWNVSFITSIEVAVMET